MYVDGRWVEAADGKARPVRNPGTAAVLDSVPVAGVTEVEAAIEAAREGVAVRRRGEARGRADGRAHAEEDVPRRGGRVLDEAVAADVHGEQDVLAAGRLPGRVRDAAVAAARAEDGRTHGDLRELRFPEPLDRLRVEHVQADEGLRDQVRVELPRARHEALRLAVHVHVDPELVREGAHLVLQEGLELLELHVIQRQRGEVGDAARDALLDDGAQPRLQIREGRRQPELQIEIAVIDAAHRHAHGRPLELPRDRRGGRRVISCDHDHADPGPHSLRQRAGHLDLPSLGYGISAESGVGHLTEA